MLITINLKHNRILAKIERESSPPAFLKGISKMEFLIDKKWLIDIKVFTYDVFSINFEIDEKTDEVKLLSFESYEESENGRYYKKQEFSLNEIEELTLERDPVYFGFYRIDWTDMFHIAIKKLPEV
ncbi:MAG: hypothetical protein JHC31_13970 [Sulfurihydrogenibium sp.]|jgi:hypothetical protein|nr:hypothetical protein [Sulfurihydrogenibium sp.]